MTIERRFTSRTKQIRWRAGEKRTLAYLQQALFCCSPRMLAAHRPFLPPPRHLGEPPPNCSTPPEKPLRQLASFDRRTHYAELSTTPQNIPGHTPGDLIGYFFG